MVVVGSLALVCPQHEASLYPEPRASRRGASSFRRRHSAGAVSQRSPLPLLKALCLFLGNSNGGANHARFHHLRHRRSSCGRPLLLLC
jgi:hypothetical protein